ncbi:hypothetical protein BT96DRAFT_606409 [Gymnopus androsaceus JB14]|uniref:DUF6534 domain-containing protein n=1 Tax=Gymnopus androsaceus JB14 TaxID=1447944 RepID=A0A6A4HVT3_9AGAR|nr:hypothetical protein BT96DRAFT_606409 [Gymnopus androsaceus JB14]
MPSLATSLGAVIVGVPLAILFTGILIVQSLIYWKSSKVGDTWRLTTVVLILLFLDLLHTMFIWSAAWRWFIIQLGQEPDEIPVTISLSVVVTAISTFIAHSIYSWRIFRLSKQNYWISLPIISLAVLRVGAYIGSGAFMIRLRSFEAFRSQVGWVFSLGLALSCIVDVLITITIMIILKKSRAKSLSLDSVIDSLIIYTLENGAVTAIATIASLICWVAMDNLIFLSLHFVIAKLYANSVLTMLNYRQTLRRAGHSSSRSGEGVDLDVIRFGNTTNTVARTRLNFGTASQIPQHPVQVNVNKTMQMHTDSLDDHDISSVKSDH